MAGEVRGKQPWHALRLRVFFEKGKKCMKFQVGRRDTVHRLSRFYKAKRDGEGVKHM